MPAYAVSRSATAFAKHRRSFGTVRSATPNTVQIRKYGVYVLGGVTIIPTKGQIWPLGYGRR